MRCLDAYVVEQKIFNLIQSTVAYIMHGFQRIQSQAGLGNLFILENLFIFLSFDKPGCRVCCRGAQLLYVLFKVIVVARSLFELIVYLDIVESVI
jgi:hypothetical protein